GPGQGTGSDSLIEGADSLFGHYQHGHRVGEVLLGLQEIIDVAVDVLEFLAKLLPRFDPKSYSSRWRRERGPCGSDEPAGRASKTSRRAARQGVGSWEW